MFSVNGFILEVFKVIGWLVLGLLLFNLTMGESAKLVTFDVIEQALKSDFLSRSFDDGKLITAVYDETFRKAVHISE